MFINRKLNALVLFKKILLPILVCVNISPLVLPSVLAVLLLLEVSLEAHSRKYEQKRLVLYKFLELILYVEHAVQVQFDVISPNEASATITATVIEASLFVYLLIPVIELGHWIYKRFCSNNTENYEKKELQEITVQDIRLGGINPEADTTINP